MRNLGIQTRTIPASAFSFLPAVFCSGASGTTRFIPTSQIQDVWIHEGFKGFEVRFYLGVVVKGEEEIVVVFPETLPRREVLEVVWRGLRGCLYEREIADGVGLGEAKN